MSIVQGTAIEIGWVDAEQLGPQSFVIEAFAAALRCTNPLNATLYGTFGAQLPGPHNHDWRIGPRETSQIPAPPVPEPSLAVLTVVVLPSSNPVARALDVGQRATIAIFEPVRGVHAQGRIVEHRFIEVGVDTWERPGGALFSVLEVGLIAVEFVHVMGGGGGSGGCAATGANERAAGGGGGEGGCAHRLINPHVVSLPETLTITVGAGGGGGAAGNNAGTDGGASKVEGAGFTTLQGDGGRAGGGGPALSVSDRAGASGLGGAASGGDLHIAGSHGRHTLHTSGGEIAQLGHGAGGHVSGWQNAPAPGSGFGGIAGVPYGGGAGGGVNRVGSQAARAGAAGASGLVVIREHYSAL